MTTIGVLSRALGSFPGSSAKVVQDFVRAALTLRWSWMVAEARAAIRYASQHTGVPAVIVAAVLLCVGYRVLRRSARWAIEVVAVAFALAAATRLGLLSW